MWGILYIYITKKGKLIYKLNRLDNNLYKNDLNTYDHKLIYKAKIRKNNVFELNTKKDFYEITTPKKKKWK